MKTARRSQKEERNFQESCVDGFTLEKEHYDLLWRKTPLKGVSKKYHLIKTGDVVGKFIEKGWKIRNFNIANSGKKFNGFQTHEVVMIPLVPYPSNAFGKEELEQQISIINSYNRRCSLKLFFGIFKLVCLNGLKVGEIFSSSSRKHIGDFNIDEAISNFENDVDKYFNIIEVMKKTKDSMNWRESAMATSLIKFGLKQKWSGVFKNDEIIINPEILNYSRRPEDDKKNLWCTFNRIQENLMKSKLKRVRKSDGMKKIYLTETPFDNLRFEIDLNKKLWQNAISSLKDNYHRRLAV